MPQILLERYSYSNYEETDNDDDDSDNVYRATVLFKEQDLTLGECLLHWREIIFNFGKLTNFACFIIKIVS